MYNQAGTIEVCIYTIKIHIQPKYKLIFVFIQHTNTYTTKNFVFIQIQYTYNTHTIQIQYKYNTHTIVQIQIQYIYNVELCIVTRTNACY